MDQRSRALFLLLIVAQAAHSVEEFAFRLYDVLAPARAISEAFGFGDRPTGFVVFNAALLLFALWCWVAQVGPGRPGARGFAWFWALLEAANGVGHVAFAIEEWGYFPGLATTFVLLPVSGVLLWRLVRTSASAASRD
jgi:hypothetical protein